MLKFDYTESNSNISNKTEIIIKYFLNQENLADVALYTWLCERSSTHLNFIRIQLHLLY